MVRDAKKPLPCGKRLLDVWTGDESGYVAGATSCEHGLGMPLICTSDTTGHERDEAFPPRRPPSLHLFHTLMVPSL